MKKRFTFLALLCLAAAYVSGQTITSFIVSPPQPGPADSITVYIHLNFNYSGCAGTAYYGGVAGNHIGAGALHCMGMLTALCADDDTVVIPPQPPGQYVFVFALSTGSGPACTPGIVPGDIDSVPITVYPVSGIAQQETVRPYAISVSDGHLSISWHDAGALPAWISVVNVAGQKLIDTGVTASRQELHGILTEGIYLVTVTGSGGKVWHQKLLCH